MTDRKPPGVSWESWVDKQIRYVNSHTISGPPTTISVLDVDNVLRKCRDRG